VGIAYYYMGEIYLRLGRFGHADIAFSTALQYSSGNAKWWARLGYAREK
jgi:cytochrome c-type biogenesis protein CcmH/NrfG